MATRRLLIRNEKGLHARASARFVETVERFDAAAQVEREGFKVAGDSIMGLMMLAAAQGAAIDLTTTGPEADALMTALEALIADRFGESR